MVNLLAALRSMLRRPPKRAAVMPPVPVLLAARQFTPVTPPAIATDPWDAEVLRQWATYSSDGSPFAAFEGHLRWTDSHLSKQVLDLEAQLASATAVHRFKP